MSVPPTLEDWETYAGDAFSAVVIIDDTAPGSETWHAHVKRSPKSTTILQEFTITAGDGAGEDFGEGDEAGNLVIVMELDGTQTQALSGKTVVWDLERRIAGEDPLTFVQGRLVVEVDITREADETP